MEVVTGLGAVGEAPDEKDGACTDNDVVIGVLGIAGGGDG